ncbi:MAG: hypothetical protein MZU97_16415 [Bacillus subtilis]|nr:hypothetical protein [Bacillus subtilis]
MDDSKTTRSSWWKRASLFRNSSKSYGRTSRWWYLVTLWVTVLGVIYTYVVVDPTYTADTSIMVQVDISGGSTSGTIRDRHRRKT